VPAGTRFGGTVRPGECVRIFTGAPVPDGADTIVIQENTSAEGNRIIVREGAAPGRHVRRAGLDFRAGQVMLRAGRVLTARDIGLAAAMNVPWLPVRRRPRVAILATGNEVVMPGDPLGPDQIAGANTPALAALAEACGAEASNLGIAPDDRAALAAMAGAAAGADLLVTTGGVSVGEHDLVRDALGDRGLELDFWRIAMRPGKPLMFGRLGGTLVLGLPGNPVSALVCAVLFLQPMLRALLGLPAEAPPVRARLGRGLPANDRRRDHLRGRLERDGNGLPVATPFDLQDSAMMAPLAAADCLIVRPPHAPAARAGEIVDIVLLTGGLAHI
jgi:molybdopterin molybdotransferase